jgi:RimJ/RimL family protein N-acetyltransferase
MRERAQVTIRPCRLADAEALTEAARESTREVFPWMEWCHLGFSRDEAEKFLRGQEEAWAERSEFCFTILDEDERLLGICAINQIHQGHRFANVGYWVRTSATGRRAATEAVRQVVEFARAETDLVRLEIVIAVGNAASARVAEKAGAAFEGTLRARLILHGCPTDALMYGIVLSR